MRGFQGQNLKSPGPPNSSIRYYVPYMEIEILGRSWGGPYLGGPRQIGWERWVLHFSPCPMAKSAELVSFSTEAPDLKTMVLRFSPCPMGKSARRQGASSRIHINARIPGSKSKISRTRGQGTQHPQILLNNQATFNTFSPFPMGKMQSKQDRSRHRNSRAQAHQMAPFPHAQWANRLISMMLTATPPNRPKPTR